VSRALPPISARTDGDGAVALTVLVTRPAEQAAEWVERLRVQGIDAAALPLIAIEPAADVAPLQASWGSLDGLALAMFVSPNAVTAFFGARRGDAAWPQALRAGATGPGTERALRAAGVTLTVAPAEPPFDSAALWSRLCREEWNGREVLIVRGDGGRDEFASSLRAAGANVHFVQAYARTAPRWHADERALAQAALAAPHAHLWLLSSGEAIEHLAVLLPGADWGRSRAIASHPRIAERARRAGFGRVIEAPPTLEAQLAAIASVESSPP
jgi:uroporphyrinogen-III synthase